MEFTKDGQLGFPPPRGHRYEAAHKEVPISDRSIDDRMDAECPQGLSFLVDGAPCGWIACTELLEISKDDALALPLLK